MYYKCVERQRQRLKFSIYTQNGSSLGNSNANLLTKSSNQCVSNQRWRKREGSSVSISIQSLLILHITGGQSILAFVIRTGAHLELDSHHQGHLSDDNDFQSVPGWIWTRNLKVLQPVKKIFQIIQPGMSKLNYLTGALIHWDYTLFGAGTVFLLTWFVQHLAPQDPDPWLRPVGSTAMPVT